jgi:predicted phosphoribosyltransferase
VPGNSEFALGAVTEAGKALIDPLIVERLQIPESYLQEETLRQSSLAQARASLYRQGRPAPKLGGATVLLVDDGLATGSTMKAAIHGVLRDGATQVFVAVPVSPPDTLREIEALADGVICLRAPREFYSVGQCYEDFGATTDAEVIQALNFHPKF